VLFISQANAKFYTYYNGRLFVSPAAGGPARALVGENEPYDVGNAMWSKDGKSIYFLVNLGVHEELFVVPASGGKPQQLTDGKHNIASIAGARLKSGPDVFVFSLCRSTSTGEIYTMRAGE